MDVVGSCIRFDISHIALYTSSTAWLAASSEDWHSGALSYILVNLTSSLENICKTTSQYSI